MEKHVLDFFPPGATDADFLPLGMILKKLKPI